MPDRAKYKKHHRMLLREGWLCIKGTRAYEIWVSPDSKDYLTLSMPNGRGDPYEEAELIEQILKTRDRLDETETETETETEIENTKEEKETPMSATPQTEIEAPYHVDRTTDATSHSVQVGDLVAKGFNASFNKNTKKRRWVVYLEALVNGKREKVFSGSLTEKDMITWMVVWLDARVQIGKAPAAAAAPEPVVVKPVITEPGVPMALATADYAQLEDFQHRLDTPEVRFLHGEVTVADVFSMAIKRGLAAMTEELGKK